MTVDFSQLRSSLVGLISFAAVEEELVLVSASLSADLDEGDLHCWAATPIVAHNTEFKRQQVERLRSIRAGRAPSTFAEIDHRSAEVYGRYTQVPIDRAVLEHRRVVEALIDSLAVTSDDDLTDPARNPWLRGRQLWLQVIVRSFWHPTGHLGEYYLEHGDAPRALALHSHAVATACYLDAPAPARGMAHYNLACTQARAGLADQAVTSLQQAVELNYDLYAKAFQDPDLAALRAAHPLDFLHA